MAAVGLGFASSYGTSFVLGPRTSSTSETTLGGALLRGTQQNVANTPLTASPTPQAVFCSTVAAGLLGARAAAKKQSNNRGKRSCLAAALDASKELGAME